MIIKIKRTIQLIEHVEKISEIIHFIPNLTEKKFGRKFNLDSNLNQSIYNDNWENNR